MADQESSASSSKPEYYSGPGPLIELPNLPDNLKQLNCPIDNINLFLSKRLTEVFNKISEKNQ